MHLSGNCTTRWRQKSLKRFDSIAGTIGREVGKGGKVGFISPPPIPNGDISTSVRLALALRYFAGGSPYDLMVKYGVSHSSVFDSVWIVAKAIKNEREFDIEYPSSHEEQRRIAHEFKKKSQVGFDNCVGAIDDGILIWMHK